MAVCALLLPAAAGAQAQQSDRETAKRAADEAWFREYIEPVLKASMLEKPAEQPKLYEPGEAAPMPGKPIPERRVWQHRARFDSMAVVVSTGDLPAARSQETDARDWRDLDYVRPEMWRFTFETVPEAAPAPKVLQ